MIADGSQVSIEYTVRLSDGTIADSNVGGEALTYEQGANQILPALEEQLREMSVGESRKISLTAAEGYGEHDPSLLHVVPASAVPEGARAAGTPLVVRSASGETRPARVYEVRGDEIVVDLNHPLAGQPLQFEVRILAIR